MRIFLLLFLVMLIECCSSASSAKTNRQLNLEFIELEGNNFLVNREKSAEIKTCIYNNNKIKARVKNFDEKPLEEKQEVEDRINRKVIQRGNFTKGIPKDHLTKNIKYDFFLCVDKTGEVLLTNIIKSNHELSENELSELLTIVFDYRYEKKMDSNCLECGKLIIKYN